MKGPLTRKNNNFDLYVHAGILFGHVKTIKTPY